MVVVQLIHRLTQADISCTTTASLFFFPLLGVNADQQEGNKADQHGDSFGGVYLGPPSGNMDPKSEESRDISKIGSGEVGNGKVVHGDEDTDNVVAQVHMANDKADPVPSEKADLRGDSYRSSHLGTADNDEGPKIKDGGDSFNVTNGVAGNGKVAHNGDINTGVVHVVVQVHVTSD